MDRRTFLRSLVALPALATAPSVMATMPVATCVNKLSTADLERAREELEKLSPPPATVEVPFNDETELAIYGEDGLLRQLYINGKPVTIAEYELWRSGVNINDRIAGRPFNWQP